MARCNCDTQCSCFLQGGVGDCITTTVTGAGTDLAPYVITADIEISAATGNSIECLPDGLFVESFTQENVFIEVVDGDCINLAISGIGTEIDPYIISADIEISAVTGNSIECLGDGLFVESTHTHDGSGGGTSLVVGGVNETGATVPTSTSLQSIAIGDFANAGTGTQPIAIGSGADATRAASATGLAAIAVGSNDAAAVLGARASGAQSVAIGGGTTAQAGASATGAQAVAIGRTSSATHSTSVALGAGATTTAVNQVRLGTAAETVSIPGFTSHEKQLYPATDALAAQTASGLLAGTGAPNDANGNDGDFYFRADGTVAGNTVMYHKEAGTWVAFTTT